MTTNPLPTEAFLKDRQVIESAADLLGVPFGTFSSESWSSNQLCSIPITTELLNNLSPHGIKKFPYERGSGFSIVDVESTKGLPGFAPSNNWGFQQQRPLDFSFNVSFQISQRERAVLGLPQFMGNASGAADVKPNMRLLEHLLVIAPGAFSPVPQKTLLKLLNENHVVTHFGELGLGGLRRLPELFAEWAAGNEQISQLARLNRTLFSFNPTGTEAGTCFVKEQFHGQLFRTWKLELETYKAALQAA
jgi:hypothetical protein